MRGIVRLLLFLLVFDLAAQNWPQFRGAEASGAGGSASLQLDKVAWKTAVPGLAHSSPIVWGNRVFVTSAISSDPHATFRRGNFGDPDASTDVSVQQWKLFCLDRKTGKILWDRIAYQGAPKEKRHIKNTYSSSSPATDGQVVVAYFGSQGLYAYDLKGKLLWKRDLGHIDNGAFNRAELEWGTASSPIIYKNLVILQCDQHKDSCIMAFDRKTGKPVWKTLRDELPSWGTPSVLGGELIANGSNFVRGYDPSTGKELWKVPGDAKITVPAPIYSDGVIIVASGWAPGMPILAVRPGGEVLWQKKQRGPYIPTPVIHDGLLYVLGNIGIFSCYELKTGEEVYRERIPQPGSGFSASPVVAGGKLYLSSEDGDIFIVGTGRKFELLGKKEMGEPLMATPAISGGLIIVRGEHNLWALGQLVP